ncbi:hypothetical protein NDU88_010328 [Pleurodeles waltl]|uniref:Uncharacterized protein n=1 Tax=Pleurodeles waltl TaxID=8319 RepID=A0AAV7Q1M4_PLEWA|nr:hypothetical protein NDU88_010328 [Pleurodeles waltl]
MGRGPKQGEHSFTPILGLSSVRALRLFDDSPNCARSDTSDYGGAAWAAGEPDLSGEGGHAGGEWAGKETNYFVTIRTPPAYRSEARADWG